MCVSVDLISGWHQFVRCKAAWWCRFMVKCVTSRHLDGTDCADLLSQNLLGLVIGGEGYVEPQVWHEEFRKCLVRDETWATKSPSNKFRLHYFYCTYVYNHVKTPAFSHLKDMGRNFPTPPEGWCRFGGAAGSGLCLGGLPTGWLWLQWWHWLYGAPWFATAMETVRRTFSVTCW